MKNWGLIKRIGNWIRKGQKSLPAGPDLELISKFSCVRDRDWPEIFVGRQSEIRMVEENCRFALDNCRNDRVTGGNIVLFSGAPGAGKTSLLGYFARTWQGETNPWIVEADWDCLENEADLVWQIWSRVLPKKVKSNDRSSAKSGQAGINIPGIGEIAVSGSAEKSPTKLNFDKLAEWIPKEQRNRPICLLIDEIQNVTKDCGKCLNKLHLGRHRLPIVIIGAGLADSGRKMERAMSPRLTAKNKRSLGALAPEEVHSYLKQMFDMCRIGYSFRNLKSVADEIAKRSEGWPQHVRTETAALFAELVRTRGRLESVNRKAVDRLAEDYRQDSYLERQSHEMRQRANLVARILKTMPDDGESMQRMVPRITEEAKKKDLSLCGLPPGMNSEDFLDHLIHRGILQLEKTNKLICPIPSLRTWLIGQEERGKSKASPAASKTRSGKRIRKQSRPAAAKKSAVSRKSNRRPKKDRGAER